MISVEAQRKASALVHALDQHLAARDAVKAGNPASLTDQTRAFLTMAVAMVLENSHEDR